MQPCGASIFSSEEGPTYEYKKDKNGNYVKVGEKGGDSFHYFYDAQGNIIAITDAKGNRIADAKEILKVSPVLTGIMDVAEFFVFGGLKGAQIAAIKAIRYLRGVSKAAKIAKGSTKAFKHGFKYANRVRARALQDPVSHNFPYSFDDAILATKPILKKNGYKIFQKAGTMNGKKGIFELGLNKNGVIDHRFFRPH